MIVIVGSALLAGLLIGAVGVGGVLLPPLLIYVGGMDAHLAVATSMWSFLFTGVSGTVAYSLQGTVKWRLAGALSLGGAPGAVLGAIVNGYLGEQSIVLALAIVTLLTGLFHLSHRGVSEEDRFDSLPPIVATGVGAVVGFGSALTGTGGPVLLVPVLLSLRVRPLTAVAVSQVIQIPLVAFATLGYLETGSVNLWMGTMMGIVAAATVFLGARIARLLNAATLQRVVAAVLVLVGVTLLIQLINIH